VLNFIPSFRIFLFLFFCLWSFFGFSQANYSISGTVFDKTTREPLPFANIVINNSRKGTSTDIDGKFNIKSDTPIHHIRLSYIGYHPLDTSGNFQGRITLYMQAREVDLSEVVILPGENPAHRIIENAIRNRNINNPENLNSYRYKAYNRMVFTVALDEKTDSTASEKNDSTNFLNKLLSKSDLFLMESVSEKKYKKPENVNEHIISSRISGFQNPNFTFLATQFQSFSLYNNYISISDKNYLNPITSGSTSKYLFIIADTLYRDNDSVFVITYRPYKGRNFDGLKGILYINSNQWAIQSIIAEPYEESQGTTVKIQQHSEFIDNKQWFPTQIHVDITFNTLRVNVYPILGLGRTYISDIEINPEISNREFGRATLSIAEDATKRTYLLDAYRGDSLSGRDMNTYHFMDSVGKDANFERLIRFFDAMLSGKIPWKFVDMDLNRFINYNDFEGFKPGIGLYSNSRLSRHFSLGGYVAFPLNKKQKTQTRYGGSLEVFLDRFKDYRIYASYSNDVEETGANIIKIKEHSQFFMPENYRDYLINRMDEVENYEFGFKARFAKYISGLVFFRKYEKISGFDYFFGEDNTPVKVSINRFPFSEAGISLRWQNKEMFFESFGHLLSAGSKWPVVYAEYIRGVSDLLDGGFDYDKINIEARQDFTIKNMGKLSVLLSGGLICGQLPVTNLYNARASYRNFSIDAPNSFSTMRMNEFFSERFLSAVINHNFGRLLINKRYFKPDIIISGAALLGKMRHHENHIGISYKTPEKGYFEGGLMFANLLRSGITGIGIGAYYRLGHYAFPDFNDNISYKLSIQFLL